MIKRTDMEFILTLMEDAIKECGAMENSMEKAFL